MAYTKQDWYDYPLETTPISAERLNHMEQGIEDAGESAGNLNIGFDNIPYQILDDVAMMLLELYTYNDEDEKEIQSYVSCPGTDTISQLRALLESKIISASDKYNLCLTKDNTESLSIYYKDGENVEHQYELESGNMPLVRYLLDNSHSLPEGIDNNSIPNSLKTLSRVNDTEYIGIDETKGYVKYNGDILPTYLFYLYGESDIYYALTFKMMYGSYSAYIIPINISTHKIVTNDYIGKRYASNQYVYYPFNLKYVVSGGNIDKTFTFNGGTSRPIFYYDGSSYQAYNSTGIPFVYTYVDGVNFDTLDLDAITAELHDGTNINYGYVNQDADIASGGTTIPSDNYYLYQLDTDKYLAINIYQSGTGIYVYATILDTANHINDASPELYGGSGSSPYISMTLHFKDLKLIDDNNSSSRTTYSSNKINQLISSLQAQINALQQA